MGNSRHIDRYLYIYICIDRYTLCVYMYKYVYIYIDGPHHINSYRIFGEPTVRAITMGSWEVEAHLNS